MIQLSIFVDGKSFTGYMDLETAREMVEQIPYGAIYRAVRVSDGTEIWL